MRFRFVSVAILLAIASRGDGRPKDPDPLDASKEAEATKSPSPSSTDRSGSLDSRYMTTMTRRIAAASPTTSSRRRDISINSFKYGSGNIKPTWSQPSMIRGLSFESQRKNYLPLGSLSFDIEQSDHKPNPTNKGSSRSTDANINNRSPLTIPFIPSPQLLTHKSTSKTIPQNNKVAFVELSDRNQRNIAPQISTPKPIPLLISQNVDQINVNSVPRNNRKLSSRNYVKIMPQRFSPVYSVRKNSTTLNQHGSNVQFKNWPNEAIQNIQDLFNYEKYTSFMDDDVDEKTNMSIEKPINHRETLIYSPDIGPFHWSKVPVIEAASNANEDVDYDSPMVIDNLLGDLGKNKANVQPQYSSEVAQNTVVHILNAGSRKPNVTVSKKPISGTMNRTKTASSRPPQNVHILFMADKDGSSNENQTTEFQQTPEALGNNADCPTILINSLTQINNTVQSKEGCTDLRIVINSHLLHKNIIKKPTVSPTTLPNSSEALKNPYTAPIENPPNDYQINTPSNNYASDDYYTMNKDPVNPSQSGEMGNTVSEVPQISSFEVFQGTHISIPQGSQNNADSFNGMEIEEIAETDEVAVTDADGSPLSPDEEVSHDAAGTNLEENADTDVPVEVPVVAVQSSNQGLGNDIVSGQANDAPGTISLTSLPNIPNLSNAAGQLPKPISSVAGGTASQAADDEDEEDELLDAISPISLLDSMSSVVASFSVLNPINYGIFGMAVAPFVAFAAGIMGVAAFLFPWAFPGSLDFARSWNDNSSKVKVRYNTGLRDFVHSSIHKYRHFNEWKGRRRKRKRKR